MPKTDERGNPQRGRTARHAQIDHAMMATAAWRSLSGNAVKVYLAVCQRHNGGNNGHIGFSASCAGKALGMGKSTGNRALRELVEKGFLVKTREAGFNTGGRLASEYRITAYKVMRQQRAGNNWKLIEVEEGGLAKPTATRDFKHWRPSEEVKPSATRGTLSVTGGTRRPELRVIGAP